MEIERREQALMNNPSANLKGKAAVGYCSEAKHVGGVVQR